MEARAATGKQTGRDGGGDTVAHTRTSAQPQQSRVTALATQRATANADWLSYSVRVCVGVHVSVCVCTQGS